MFLQAFMFLSMPSPLPRIPFLCLEYLWMVTFYLLIRTHPKYLLLWEALLTHSARPPCGSQYQFKGCSTSLREYAHHTESQLRFCNLVSSIRQHGPPLFACKQHSIQHKVGTQNVSAEWTNKYRRGWRETYKPQTIMAMASALQGPHSASHADTAGLAFNIKKNHVGKILKQHFPIFSHLKSIFKMLCHLSTSPVISIVFLN